MMEYDSCVEVFSKNTDYTYTIMKERLITKRGYINAKALETG